MVNFSVANTNVPNGEWLVLISATQGFLPQWLPPVLQNSPPAGLGARVEQYSILLMQVLGIRFDLAARAVGCWDIFKPSALGTANQPECQPRKGLRCELALCLQTPFLTLVIRGNNECGVESLFL